MASLRRFTLAFVGVLALTPVSALTINHGTARATSAGAISASTVTDLRRHMSSWQIAADAVERSWKRALLAWRDRGLEPCSESMFAAILSRPENREGRDFLREMWRSQARHWKSFTARFVVCESGNFSKGALLEEAGQLGDLLILPCAEGYEDGALTRKVAAAMRAFAQNFTADLFLKTDDDSYVSTKGICSILQKEQQYRSELSYYMGVFAEGPYEQVDDRHLVNRDPTSAWHESEAVYPFERYPKSAKGGPGYVLSWDLVDFALRKGMPEKFPLNNEDKAIGVWVDQMIESDKFRVDFVNLPGTDGYPEHADFTVTSGPLADYNYCMHHALSGATIQCLHRLEEEGDGNALVDSCFAL